MYKHLFSDMDNTLLRTDGSFSEENARVIKFGFGPGPNGDGLCLKQAKVK